MTFSTALCYFFFARQKFERKMGGKKVYASGREGGGNARSKRAKEIYRDRGGKGAERVILSLLLKDRGRVADTALPIR